MVYRSGQIIDLDRSFYRLVTIHACDRRTDGRTDGRTDRILIDRPCVHFMQRGKNYSSCARSSDINRCVLCIVF